MDDMILAGFSDQHMGKVNDALSQNLTLMTWEEIA